MNGAAQKSGQIQKGDILQQIDGNYITTIQEAKQLIVGDEGTIVRLNIARPGIGEFDLRIARGTGATTAPGSGGAGSSGPGSIPHIAPRLLCDVRNLMHMLSRCQEVEEPPQQTRIRRRGQ